MPAVGDVPWSPACGGVPSPASAAVRTGPGATSSAVGSEVRGRSRAGGGSPEAGGWSWSLVTRPVLCRFAPGMKSSLCLSRRIDSYPKSLQLFGIMLREFRAW